MYDLNAHLNDTSPKSWLIRQLTMKVTFFRLKNSAFGILPISCYKTLVIPLRFLGIYIGDLLP